MCKKCGAIYGIDTIPKKKGICDKCGTALYKRKDDTKEVIKERLKVYEEQTEPLIEYYKKKEIYEEVDGELKISKILENILELIKSKGL